VSCPRRFERRNAAYSYESPGQKTYCTERRIMIQILLSQTLECSFLGFSRARKVAQFPLRFSAKHLHSSEEQLHSLAGSFGYVAPEVLSRKGHGKPVDIWSTGYVLTSLFVRNGIHPISSVITYVLLCGYAPFRSEDPKELVRETMAAKIEFHDRYWKNVSQQGATSLLSHHVPRCSHIGLKISSQGLYQVVAEPRSH